MARKRNNAYKENPFIKDYVENTNFKRVITSAVREDGSLVQSLVGKDPLTVKDQGLFKLTTKVIDSTPFLKIKANALNPYKELTSAGLKVFGILMDEISGLTGKDKMEVVLSWDFLTETQQNDMSKQTFKRGINDLIDANFIAASLVNDVFFINPAMIYNGDSVLVATHYIRKGSQSAIKFTQKVHDMTPLFEQGSYIDPNAKHEALPSGRTVNKETGEVIEKQGVTNG